MNHRISKQDFSRNLLILEFIIICICVPLCMIYFKLAAYMFVFLWVTTLICILSYRSLPNTKGVPIWRWEQLNWQNFKPMLIRFAISAVLLTSLVLIFMPEKAFGLLQQRPELWVRIMIFYPLVSAVPQEFIFCTYFFARFTPLFKTEKHLVFAATLIFATTHILYINPIAPVLSAFAGYFFAQTFSKTRSLALVSIEHALYGNLIFTLGLGLYFFGGRAGQ